MSRMRAVVKVIESVTVVVSGYFQAVLLFLLMVLILVEVLTRYVLHSPLGVSDEMGGYMLVSITFIGLAYTWKEDGHVRVDLFIDRLPSKAKKWIRLVNLFLATGFSIPLIKGSYDLLCDSLLFGSRSGSWLRTPLVYPQTVLLIGSVLIFLQLVAELIKFWLGSNESGGGSWDQK
jgi:TRAP-type C4-dicarboxylate transport system permease small subunit